MNFASSWVVNLSAPLISSTRCIASPVRCRHPVLRMTGAGLRDKVNLVYRYPSCAHQWGRVLITPTSAKNTHCPVLFVTLLQVETLKHCALNIMQQLAKPNVLKMVAVTCMDVKNRMWHSWNRENINLMLSNQRPHFFILATRLAPKCCCLLKPRWP